MDKIKRSRAATRMLAALFTSALLVTTAGAGRQGGGGGKDRVVPTGNEKCWVEPNPVNDGTQYTVWGSGFKGGQVVSVFVGDGGILLSVADGLGFFTAKDWASFRDPATIGVNIYQSGDRRMTLLANCSFQANGTR